MIGIFFLIVGGILLGYVYPPYNFTPFLFISFIPLFWYLREKKGFFYTLLGGLVYYFSFAIFASHPIFNLIKTSLFQYLQYPSFVILLLSILIYFFILLIYSIPYILFSFMIPYFLRRDIKGIFFLSFLFTFLEYLFSLFVPDPYILGYGIWVGGFVIHIIRILGVYGISMIIVLSNFLLFLSFYKEKRRYYFLSFVLIVVMLYIPFVSVDRVKGKTRMLKVSIIQERVNFYRADFFKELEALINDSLKTKVFHPDLIVWPESAIPVRLSRYLYIRDLIAQVPRRLDSYLVFGTYGEGRGMGKYNQAVVMDNKGNIIKTYRKQRIIPFFEGPPSRSFLKKRYIFSDRDFIRGKGYKFFNIGDIKIGILICSEVLYPDMFMKVAKSGVDMVIILSNEVALPRRLTLLLLKIARIKAIEGGVYILRANTTGESALISPYGIIQGGGFYGRRRILNITLLSHFYSTPYIKVGPLYIVFGLIFSFFLSFIRLPKSGRSNKI